MLELDARYRKTMRLLHTSHFLIHIGSLRIVNYSLSTTLSDIIPLKRLADNLPGIAKYQNTKMNILHYHRPADPSTTCMVFPNGKVLIKKCSKSTPVRCRQGTRKNKVLLGTDTQPGVTLSDLEDCASQLLRDLTGTLDSTCTYKLPVTTITMATFSLRFPVHISRLAKEYECSCTYDTEITSGLWLEIPLQDSMAKAAIFSSGSVILVNIKNATRLVLAADIVANICKKFQRTDPMATSEDSV